MFTYHESEVVFYMEIREEKFGQVEKFEIVKIWKNRLFFKLFYRRIFVYPETEMNFLKIEITERKFD